jgi:DNA-binding NarL/FixJ family response regulator
MSIRVLLAEIHPVIRDTLGSLIDHQPDMEMVGQAQDARTAARLIRERSPDVAVIDVDRSGFDEVEATRRITTEVPGIKTIALSMYDDRRMIAAVLGAGASGYLLKNGSGDELIQAIRAVIAGLTYLSPGFVSHGPDIH